MTRQNELQQPLHPQTLGKRAIQGAGIALLLALLFIIQFGVLSGEWVFLPLLTVSFGGALGGVIYYLLDPLRQRSSWQKGLANIFCLAIYCAILWISLILALAITGHWD